MKLTILNGPNLNMLGTREPGIYGSTTLADIEARCAEKAAASGIELEFKQSNHEGELVDWIQAANAADGLIINAGAFTHTSVALHDALLTLDIPIIELHISNVFKREEFRHHSFISRPATAVICGLGVAGYPLAMDAIVTLINEKDAQ